MSQTSVTPGMVKSVALGNRRATIRYRCAPATIGKLISAEDHEFQLACVLDLSLRGIGMQVCRPIAAGRIMVIALKPNDGTKAIELSALVMHCNSLPHDEWYVGCELMTPLTSEQLEQLL